MSDKRYWLGVLSYFILFQLSAQHTSADFRFVRHLFHNNDFSEAALYLNDISTQNPTYSTSDSIHYYTGKAYYELKEIDLSVHSFSRVSRQSCFYHESQLLSGFQLAYIGKYRMAADLLNGYVPDSTLYAAAKDLELAGIYLLSRDLPTFELILPRLKSDFYQIEDAQNSIFKYYNDIRSHKKRSPFLAMCLSAVVPGSGKIYAGETGQGIAAFLVNGLFALQARESYRKDGLGSTRFIVFGSLFSIFYISNIFGSGYAVKIRTNKFNEAVNSAILVDMHIPLRVLFR